MKPFEKNTNSLAVESDDQGCYLPDFCHSETNLRLILVVILIAIVAALISTPDSNLYTHVASIALYMLWISLCSAVVFCLLKRFDQFRSPLWTTLISLMVVGVITAGMSQLAIQLNQTLGLNFFEQQSIWLVTLKHTAISQILFGLALRYFYLQFHNQRMLKAEGQARLQALQARIRPHFLFNSLNTIASLTHSEADKAEMAIENLADLFRASLGVQSIITVEEEIELTREYIELETLRLDDRLEIDWYIDADTKNNYLPALTLQPLVENAIYHGIEPLPEGGRVSIHIEQLHDHMLIAISNPISGETDIPHREGNRMALKNITERLDITFNGKAKIEHLSENQLYRVSIKTPLTDPKPVV